MKVIYSAFWGSFLPLLSLANAESLRRTTLAIDPLKSCRVEVASRKYDLCSLLRGGTRRWSLAWGDERTEYTFDAGSGSAGVELGQPSAVPDVLDLVEFPAYFTLKISGKRPYCARIDYECTTRDVAQQPRYSGVDSECDTFSWHTPHSCTLLHAFEEDSDSQLPQNSSEPDNPDDHSDDFRGPDQRRVSRISLVLTFIVISAVVVLCTVISYRGHGISVSVIQNRVSPLIDRLRVFEIPSITIPHSLRRTGQGKLVQWAHEDLELGEDFMVNGSFEPDDTVEDTGDEYIPLRPSPRKGQMKNYGSAPASPFW
ncbi:unnamed protein product [Mycena citricolor]|uniref:Autophagy-related protein 27 n=1 Tax=Mycena citricolor TaxID=2018698 RepID=A0AAD2Q528_9AGAR|nr:unnamed protein product [Mycena citricolor]